MILPHCGWLGKRRRSRLSVASKIAKIAQMSFKAVAFSLKEKMRAVKNKGLD